jgi:endonuclease-3
MGRIRKAAAPRSAPQASRRESDRSRSPRPGSGRVSRLLEALEKAHPEARCALDYRSPFQLLVATILSAQCTDQRVNLVTPGLFASFPDARAMASADLSELESIIRSTGFFRAKAKSLIGAAKALVEDHGGEVPPSMEALVRLPGTGRKTANVVLGQAFGRNDGIAVDTHVFRVANRLGVALSEEPAEVERQLMSLFPRNSWTRVSNLLIFHGRKVCDARKPACGRCTLFPDCRWEKRQAWAHTGSGAAPANRQRRTSPRRNPGRTRRA